MSRLFICVLALAAMTPLCVYAKEYIPLVGIPGVDPNKLSTEDYINTLYTLSISLAAFLAVGRIIFAGVQYMLSDIVTSKEQAKKDIQGALLGLGIVLGAVLILQTINPELTEFNFLRNAPSVKTTLDTTRVDVYVPSDETGRISTEGLTGAQREAAFKKLQNSCSENIIIVGNNARCPKREENVGTRNSTARYQQFIGEVAEGRTITPEQYNEFVASVEAADVTEQQINQILTENEASDYFFVVKNLQNGNDEEKRFRQQQQLMCEESLSGALVDKDDFTVCVLE